MVGCVRGGTGSSDLAAHDDDEGVVTTTQHVRSVFTERRELVCVGCVRKGDFVFGNVHSEAKCHRCGKSPCGYGVVVGPSPFAEAR